MPFFWHGVMVLSVGLDLAMINFQLVCEASVRSRAWNGRSHIPVSLWGKAQYLWSAVGERKRTMDLLLGPDLYTFLVLFFTPQPLGHTKGL